MTLISDNPFHDYLTPSNPQREEIPPIRLIQPAKVPPIAGFTVYTLTDFEGYVPAKDDAILGEGNGQVFWRDREIAYLAGPGGCGKSRFILCLAVAQILSRPFCGFMTFGPPRTWLLLSNENSPRRIREELRKICAGLTPAERDLIDRHLFIQALLTDADSDISLDEEEALKRWQATAACVKPDIVVVDPWEAVIAGGDCNDSKATRASVGLLRTIFNRHSLRLAVMIVHHSREGAEAIRKAEGFDAGAFGKGSKTLRSMARFGVNIAPTDPDSGGTAILACGKINDGRKFITRGIVLDEESMSYSLDHAFDLDAWRNDVEGKQRNLTCSIADVVTAVREGKHTAGAIVEACKESTGASPRTIKTRLAEAEKEGYLAKCPPRGSYTLGNKRLS